MLQPRRIGNVETPEWQELYRFYQGLERQERHARLRTIAKVCVMFLPVVFGVITLVR